MTEPLGYVDELIRYMDSGKKLFQIADTFCERNLQWIKPSNEWATALTISPKFSLPTLGQFYRDVDELNENKRSKFAHFAEDYELQMLQFPPFPQFVLEFAGFDKQVKIQSNQLDYYYDKYIILITAINQPDFVGIQYQSFYYLNSSDNIEIYDTGFKIPPGWHTTNVPFVLRSTPKDELKDYKHPILPDKYVVDYRIRALITDPKTYRYHNVLFSTMWPEIRAMLQFFVVLNTRHGVIATEKRTPKSKVPTLKGRQTGYSYRVLEIDPDYVTTPSEELGGTHSSPRFHLRRAHIRYFPDIPKYKKPFTFVRGSKVGNLFRGHVSKDYILKKPD